MYGGISSISPPEGVPLFAQLPIINKTIKKQIKFIFFSPLLVD